jgi:hypothetical protein
MAAGAGVDVDVAGGKGAEEGLETPSLECRQPIQEQQSFSITKGQHETTTRTQQLYSYLVVWWCCCVAAGVSLSCGVAHTRDGDGDAGGWLVWLSSSEK